MNLINPFRKNFEWVKQGWYTPMTSPIVPIFGPRLFLTNLITPLCKNAQWRIS